MQFSNARKRTVVLFRSLILETYMDKTCNKGTTTKILFKNIVDNIQRLYTT